jgi:N-acetyl-anhydromuramyl-L-alanine amidase AmpD
MRKISEIILHCTASKSDPSVAIVTKWHVDQGWDTIGYHFLIRVDGTIETGRQLERIGAHTKGHNTGTIGIALNGLDQFSKEQFESCAKLIVKLKKRFGNLKISGHNEYSSKKCPVFNIDIIKGLVYGMEKVSDTSMGRRT